MASSDTFIENIWICRLCTFENNILLPYCEMCNTTQSSSCKQATNLIGQQTEENGISSSTSPNVLSINQRGREGHTVTITTGLTKQIDKGLQNYYRHKNTQYLNENGVGKFLAWADENGYVSYYLNVCITVSNMSNAVLFIFRTRTLWKKI